MKIVVLDGYTLNPGDLSWKKLEELGTLTVYERTPAELISQRIGDAEIIYTNKTPLTAETINAAPNLKFIGVLATGYNVVDTAAAKAKNIPVTNIPTYGTAAVSQYVFALLLEICHHIGHHSQTVRDGEWASSPDFCYWHYPLIELFGKTLGIIGYGRIGQATAKIAHGFGMKVLAYDANPIPSGDPYAAPASLEEILINSDVISLHCPLFDSTRHMINRDSISKMKTSAIIINTSRGPLIEEHDLAEALNSGRIAAAAMDVVSTEPIAADNPLLTAKNCIITPHIAWAPLEARERLMNIAIDNLTAFCKGQPINVVNM